MSDFTSYGSETGKDGEGEGEEAEAGKADLVNSVHAVQPDLVITIPESHGANAAIGQDESGTDAMINPTPHSEG